MAAISSGAASCSDRQMVEAEHHQRVGVGQNPFVDGQLVSRLVDALEHGDRVAGGFAGNCWKLSVERWNSSSVPAIPWRNCVALHSGVS